MPSSYTTSLRLTLPATGELAGQWGNTVNTGITELLDAAVAGTTSISTWGGAGVAYTLSNNAGTSDEARRMFILATGAPGEAKNVICPAVSKFYVFRNDTTGGFALTLKTPSGTGIAVPAGQYKFLYCNGTNVVEAFNSAGALTLSGALSVGGTTTLASNPTLSAGTANQVQYLNGSKVLVGSANLTFDGTTLTAANFADSSLTATRVTYAGASGNLTDSANMTFNGTDLTVSGAVNAGSVNATTLDLTNLEVTNIKAKDGTASMTLADATGVASFSANPVLSGGTANGVLYLNGSKVATSGSALTFDGSIVSNTGVGFNVNNANALYRFQNGSGTRTGYLQVRADAFEVWSDQSAVPMVFGTSNSEQMRLTSTGLGIGTSSPSAKLNVVGTGDMSGIFESTGTGNAASAIIRSGNGTTSGLYAYARFVNNDTNAQDWRIGTYGNNNLSIVNAKAGTTPVVLDASGNLGLGVTPSAWASYKAIQVGPIGSVSSVTGATIVGNNWFYDGDSKYITTATATIYEQGAGTHKWYNAPSGTAGNAISFTQAMTLEANGNLSVGTTDTTAVRFKVQSGSNPIVFLSGFTGAGTMGVIGANPLAIYTNGSERARIDSSGNLGLGVTPSAWASNIRALQIKAGGLTGALSVTDSGAYIVSLNEYLSGGLNLYTANGFASRYQQVSGAHAWLTAPSGTAGNAISFTQAMTLDASGNLLVGTTSSASISGVGTKIRYDAASPDVTTVGSVSTNSFTTYNVYSTGAAAFRFYVGFGGTVYATSTTITAISDQRLKENIRDLDAGLPEIMALKPRKFDWKPGKGKDKKNDRGWIAQEFEQVFPDMVDTWQDPAPEGEEPYKAVNADLIPVLVKAIQEQQALITDLRARVAALESN